MTVRTVALVLILGQVSPESRGQRPEVITARQPDHARTSDLGPRTSVRPRTSVLRSDVFWSQALGIRKKVVVWLPPSYGSRTARRYPVAYYLHGAWGDETNWTRLAHLNETLDSLTAAGMPEMIVVMPDGDDGFYTTWNFLGDYPGCRRAHADTARERADSYCVPWPKYDDYIARDLVAYVDRTYRTRADRRHRGIAGLSMGGYGAVALALAYPDVFSAAASHSGVLAPMVGPHRAGGDTRYASSLDSLRIRYGVTLWTMLRPVFGPDTAGWLARDPVRLASRLKATHPASAPSIRVDCGTDDFLIDQNRVFVSEMQRLGWPVEYAEYPGAHTWDYWRRHSVESARWLAVHISR